MKAAMVETGGWGGIAHYAWDLCAALAGTGVEVSLLTNRKWELERLPARFEVERCFAGDAGYLGNVKALRQAIARARPDVVHVQSLISTRLDAVLWPWVRRRRPVVMTAHNIRSHERIRWDDWTLWRCLAAADAVVVHTQRAEEVARRRLGEAARIELIHHGSAGFFGTDDRPDRSVARARLELPREGKIVLAFGAIRPYKGLFGAIAAIAELRRRGIDARLVIAGPLLIGSEAEYRDAIRREAAEDAVIFRPRYVPGEEEVAAYFTAADVAVFNYRDITDSGSLRLACDLGAPVVATAVGSFREFLTDGVTARLVEPGDTPALVAALAAVLADPEGAARMARAARALAASVWSWAESAKATAALYETIARGGA
ncbi:MAG TPA: glycosyltransferase family 4 protein [Methylomirabilota bacterium]|nr:glycosyltransferase family 4 protein [Methylomirabilota bacterium]